MRFLVLLRFLVVMRFLVVLRFLVFLFFFLFFLPPVSVYGGDFPLVNLVSVLSVLPNVLLSVLPNVFFTYDGGGSYFLGDSYSGG
jgi:hypothetical protein